MPTNRAKIACGRCGAVRSEREWSALPAVAEVAGPELERLVSRWPSGGAVVVRACSCGASIARIARTTPLTDETPRPPRA